MKTNPNCPVASRNREAVSVDKGKEVYTAPEIEIIEVKVEQGFAQSNTPGPWEPGGDW